MKTKTIFRVFECNGWGREVVAIFPELAGDSNPYQTCLCYAHVGQHSAITTDFPTWTRPATPAEYADLLQELTSNGYDVRVCKRVTRGDLQKRIEQTRAD